MAALRAVVDIPATMRGPQAARGVVEAIVLAWDRESLAADAALVISELVTNAVQHAPGSDSFELEALCTPDGVRLSIADGSSVRPVIAELNHDRPTGRGMLIVEALAASWGAEEHHGGKRVWVELRRNG